MAARFDASRAARLNQNSGDGTPIMVTIPTKAPWVPLRILSPRLNSAKVVQADVFPAHRSQAGSPGRRARAEPRSQRAGQRLVALRPAVRQAHGVDSRPHVVHVLKARRAGGDLDYDLAISTRPGVRSIAAGCRCDGVRGAGAPGRRQLQKPGSHAGGAGRSRIRSPVFDTSRSP